MRYAAACAHLHIQRTLLGSTVRVAALLNAPPSTEAARHNHCSVSVQRSRLMVRDGIPVACLRTTSCKHSAVSRTSLEELAENCR